MFYCIDFYGNTLQEPNDRMPGLSPSGKYEKGYESVYHLMPHTDDMPASDLLQYSMVSD